MSLNHDVQSPSRENYVNGCINDFTDCIDFTKQYQKSCGFEEDLEVLSDIQGPVGDPKSKNTSGKCTHNEHRNEFGSIKPDSIEKASVDFVKDHNGSLKIDKPGVNNDVETDFHPMEPDVSITIGESNLEKTISQVATGSQAVETGKNSPGVGNSNNFKKKISKQKLIKKNHLKLPVNKSVKKKVSLFKFKNGKHVKKKNESFQYQGVQSNIKFKCYKCSYSDLSTISELQSHQRKCLSGASEFQSINESSSVTNSSSSNFRITRKVYLCSACGSYYENWNLFLHMKEMHKRHICLYCLGMFSQPDKLAQHLQTKHNVIEQSLSTTDEFLKAFRGTCYLTCVSCEAMFSEQENFYEHSCMSAFDDSSSCPLCGLQGAHFPTCRRGFSDRYLESEYQRSHPALGKKFNAKKKKMKSSKKPREMFQIVNNENSGEMSVIVRKQPSSGEFNENGTDTKMRENALPHKDSNDSSVMMSALKSTNDLISSKQYNEKLLQLYRPGKTSEKVVSSIQSIEDSINRVVENLRMAESSENDIGKNEGEEAESDINCDAQEKESLIYEKGEFPSLSESNLPPALFPDSVNSAEDAERNADNTEELSNSVVENEENEVENGFVRRNEKKINENLVVSECESTDSEKLTIAFDQPSEQYFDRTEDISESAQPTLHKSEENIPTAPKDTSYIHVSVVKECENELKKLIKEFVKVSCWNCVYCSHAKRIALNGKQLVLHILAEHRFVTVPEDSSEEEKEISASDIIQRLKSNLHQFETVYFNSDTFDSENKELWKVNDRIYECFHCLFATYVHKELCSHNRKMHQKAMFLCIMCKSNFYTYSELLCHLCPGIYVSGQVINPDITYRCFLCDVEPLPSSFRLMVHLRRKHNSCDICFDQSANQFQLSTHVWKHKLSHMCYRCGIAYRNKPDITKHLFWKHGTESVLCKKCLQKKWPHVYHFCVPPNNFICDECSATLKSAVALKVHKRLHSDDYPYPCTKCEEKFISRKLLEKHLDKHEEKIENLKDPDAGLEPPETESSRNCDQGEEVKTMESEVNCSDEADKKPEKEKKPKKKKVINDVFDLPPVNLSESDDSDTEEPEIPKVLKSVSPAEEETPSIPNGYGIGCTQKEEPSPTQIVDGVWNNFQNYLVAKDMPKTFKPPSPFKNMTLSRIKEIMLSDHDYHIIPNFAPQDVKELTKVDTEKSSTEKNKKAGLDHDYCNNIQKGKISCKSKQKIKEREDASKSSSSDSSSDSDSSCSCGSNCSCSSGSSSSTSSNDSDSDSRGKKRQKKAEKESNASAEAPEPPTEVDISVHDISNENLIRESDLDTDETETDEDFYDYNPAREANRILAEKRTQLLANLNGSETVTSSPTVSSEKPASPKKKAKIKKKRSQARSSAASKSNRKKSGTFATAAATAAALNRNRVHQVPTETVATNSIPNVPYESSSAVGYARLRPDVSAQSPVDGDAKRPKRKRVPLKFYGFSSDDESDVTPTSKKREKGEHNTTTPAPQAPIAYETSANGTPSLWNPHSRGSLSWRIEKSDANTPKVNPIKIRTSQSGGKVTPTVENTLEGGDLFHLKRNFQVNGNPVAHKGEKLYCFCQCPYDEVSEMIACDAEDCLIEWFHFECVGIMVPPKGSWYCPDCRKKLAAEHEFMTPPTTDPVLN